jgi:hypothetical protein
MSRTCLTKPAQIIAGLLTAMLFAVVTVPLGAAEPHPYYDKTQEITLKAAVSSVLTMAEAGMVPGGHLLLTTASGAVDASLGRFGLVGKGALSVAVGEQVEVTGMMKTLGNKQVFLVRSVKAGGRVYTMRNEYGVQVSPQSRLRASQKTTQKGESL